MQLTHSREHETAMTSTTGRGTGMGTRTGGLRCSHALRGHDDSHARAPWDAAQAWAQGRRTHDAATHSEAHEDSHDEHHGTRHRHGHKEERTHDAATHSEAHEDSHDEHHGTRHRHGHKGERTHMEVMEAAVGALEEVEVVSELPEKAHRKRRGRRRKGRRSKGSSKE